jgi:hypothetical protein
MHYKEPLGIIRSIIPPFFLLLASICAALIQSMSECLWRIGQEKSGASCGLASNQKRQKEELLVSSQNILKRQKKNESF